MRRLNIVVILVTALGNAFGFVAINLFLMAPVPTVGYLLVVRYSMQHFNVDYEARSKVFNLVLMAGFAIAILVSMAIFGSALPRWDSGCETRTRPEGRWRWAVPRAE